MEPDSTPAAQPANIALDRLRIYNVDLHYHAGTERSDGCSLDDYLEYAVLTGRVVVGVTDHFGRFLYGGEAKPGEPYERSREGFLAFHRDVVEARSRWPQLALLFAPEFGPGAAKDITDEHISRSDYFIFEPHPLAGPGSLTDTLTATVRDCRALMDRTGIPAFVAHPFRSTVNLQVAKHGIAPWAAQLEPLGEVSDLAAEVNAAFEMDVLAVAKAFRECDVPMEVNTETQSRILTRNLYAYHDRLRAVHRIMRDQGVDLVPSSDIHSILHGTPVPHQTFHELGLAPSDIRFLRRLWDRMDAASPGGAG